MIYNLELVSFKKGSEHSWTGAKEEMTKEEKDAASKLEALVKNAPKADGNAAASEAAATPIAEPEKAASTSTVPYGAFTSDDVASDGPSSQISFDGHCYTN